jgi:hypothetical protein
MIVNPWSFRAHKSDSDVYVVIGLKTMARSRRPHLFERTEDVG